MAQARYDGKIRQKGRGKLSEDEITSILRREITIAQGFDSDILSEIRAKSMDFFFGNDQSSTIPTAPAGRSNVQSLDVRDVTLAILSQIGPMYKASSIEFKPRAHDDEKQADLESQFVREIIEDNDGFKAFSSAAWYALLQNTGWIHVSVDDHTDVSRETYTGLDDMQVANVVDQGGQVEVDSYDEATGNLKITRTTETRQLKIEPISADMVLHSPGLDQYGVDGLRFVAYRKIYSVAELVAMGMSMEDAMETPSHRDDHWPAVIAKAEHYSESSDNELGGVQDATTLKECFHCWAQLDLNETGQWERYHILIAGKDGAKIVYMEPAPFVPMVAGCAIPVPHRIEGQGMGEVMGEIQTQKTAILRQYMDNLAVMNSSRMGAVEGQVNMKDLTDGRVNGVVRIKRPDAIVPLPATDAGMQAIQGLRYLDELRTSRGGAALDLNNSEMQIAQTSATAATNEYAAKERMSGWYCNNLIQTLMVGVFKMVHQTLRLYFDQPMDIAVNGNWEQQNPGSWQARDKCKVTVGLSPMEKRERAAGLQAIMQTQLSLASAGGSGVIVDQSRIYKTFSEWVKCLDVGEPFEFVLDPSSPQAKQAQQQNAAAQQAQQQMAMNEQDKQLASQREIEFAKMSVDWNKHSTELDYKYWETAEDNDADLEAAQMKKANESKGNGTQPKAG